MSQAGAPAALAGYRLQALYTLKRILSQSNEESIFQPEGLEDLDILDSQNIPLELIQVKSYEQLRLSDLGNLSLEKTGSFFGRVVKVLENKTPPPIIKLVNYGGIGPELSKGWSGSERERKSLISKFTDAGFSQFQIDQLFAHVELLSLEESQDENEVYDLLRIHGPLGIDPTHAFDLLHSWLFLCMEKRKKISYGDVIEKETAVGRILAERRDFYDQWFTTIQPIEDRKITLKEYDKLKKEFFEGGFTRYEHILAELDFYREEKLTQIKIKFESSNIVIIHAASGQGKTTLAYRYLHEHFPNNWRVEIQRIESIQQALSVANTLNGYANSLQVPMAVFIDVQPHNTSWLELVRQLARHPYLQILVTIREEDYRRANISGNGFDFEEIDLEFQKDEAKLIYERVDISSSNTKHLDFEETWDAFGSGGPLLEFVYLLTQTTTLRHRLESQVNRIRREVRERYLAPDELKLLILASVATSCEARLDTRILIEHLDLPEPNLSLDYFEKEFLIRVSNRGQFIEGLHSIRSSILAELLTSTNYPSWKEAAIEVLPLILEEDLENFLLHAFISLPSLDFPDFLEAMSNLSPKRWAGMAGVLRSLLWVGVHDYIYANKTVIEAAHEEFGPGWFFFLDMNFAGNVGPKIDKWWEDEIFSRFFPLERAEKTEQIRSAQTPKENVFTLAKNWLTKLNTTPRIPEFYSDWVGIADVLYWAKRFEYSFVEEWISDDILDTSLQETSLPILADVIYALFFIDEQRYRSWLERNKEVVQNRLATDYGVVSLQEDASLLTLHFLPSLQELKEEEKDTLHHQTIERIQLVSQLFPAYEKYGSQGYGHKLGLFAMESDSSEKSGIQKAYLVPDFLKRLNGIASGIARNQLRLETWDEYINALLNIRQNIIICLEQLPLGLGKFLERQKPVNIGADYIDKAKWQVCVSLVNYPPDLPKVAVDQWGFTNENSSKSYGDGNNKFRIPQAAIQIRRAATLGKMSPYLELQRKYFTSIHNFMLQTVDVMATNFNLSKLPPQRNRKRIIAELQKLGIKTDMAHLSSYNLWEAKQALGEYQRKFRQLFGHRIDLDELEVIEKQESKLFEQVWQLWYFYAYEPRQTIPRAIHKVPIEIENAKRKLDRELKQAITVSNIEGVNIEFLHTDLAWNSLPAKWIRLDMEDTTRYYEAFEVSVAALRTVLSPIKFQDLDYYLIQENFPYIVIVPTVQGRMINENVWPLFTASTVMNEAALNERNWASFVPKPIPVKTRETLQIELWDLYGLEQANQFSTDVTVLMLLASQISEFINLPEPSDAGLKELQAYLSGRSKELTEALQSFMDTGDVLRNIFNSLPENEKERHPLLDEAIQKLSEITNVVHPPEWADEQQMQVSETLEYAQRLSEVFLEAEYVKLLWIADILDDFSR